MKSKNRKKYQDIYRDVTLRISGKTLNPEDITNLLQIKPTSFCTRGYQIFKSGKKRYLPEGKWYLRLKSKNNNIFETKIRKLSELIRPRRKELKDILKKYEAELDISIQPHPKIALWGYIFPADLMNEFTSLGINITFHIWNC